jgi:hypothetical protein
MPAPTSPMAILIHITYMSTQTLLLAVYARKVDSGYIQVVNSVQEACAKCFAVHFL